MASVATPPGTCATCSASCPRLHDFGCGRQSRWASGTRSSTRLVAPASCSSSCSNAVAIAMTNPPEMMKSLLVLGKAANPRVQDAPAAADVLPDVVGNEAQRRVPEGDERSSVDGRQPVLHIGNNRRGNE